jgi:hypothetical protein
MLAWTREREREGKRLREKEARHKPKQCGFLSREWFAGP